MELETILVMLAVGAIVVLMAWFPAHVAKRRRHPHLDAIRVASVMFVLIWFGMTSATSPQVTSTLTGLIWAAILVWSYACKDRSKESKPTTYVPRVKVAPRSSPYGTQDLNFPEDVPGRTER